MKIPDWMIVYSFRYCLGRMTYAVSDFVEWAIENWDNIPLALFDREEDDEPETSVSVNKVDRVDEWEVFSKHMEEYISERTVEKYAINSSTFDLISFTNPIVCIWNVLKYTLRIMNGKAKEHDVEKIAHYIQIYWTKLKN